MKSYTPVKCEHRGIRFEVTADREHAYWRIEDGPFRRTTFVGQTTGETLMREAIREAREFIDRHLESRGAPADAHLTTCHPEQAKGVGQRFSPDSQAAASEAKDPDQREALSDFNSQLSACHPEQVCWLYETAFSSDPPRDAERNETPLIERA